MEKINRILIPLFITTLLTLFSLNCKQIASGLGYMPKSESKELENFILGYLLGPGRGGGSSVQYSEIIMFSNETDSDGNLGGRSGALLY